MATFRAVSDDSSIDATIQVGVDSAAANEAFERESANIDGLPAVSAITVVDSTMWYVLDFDEATQPTLEDAERAISDPFLR